jgi:hypothetical protein
VRRFAVICFACAAALLAAGSAHARSSCWEQVISDWSAHNRIKGNYSAGCYRQALNRLPEDLRTYSSAPEDIRQALQSQLTKSPVVAAPKSAQAAANADDGGSSNRQLLLFGAILVAVVAIAVVAIR